MRGTKGNEGHDRLWGWFGLSYASFLVLPRVLMHEMPDEWQAKMAKLLEEYDERFDTGSLPGCKVQAVTVENKFRSWPDWVLNYRRPDRAAIADLQKS